MVHYGKNDCRSSVFTLKHKTLLNHFVMDMYVNIAEKRLQFLLYNQNKLRAKQHMHGRGALATDVANAGQLASYLLSMGHPLPHIHRRTQNAMTYVQHGALQTSSLLSNTTPIGIKRSMHPKVTCFPSQAQAHHDGDKAEKRLPAGPA